MLPILRPKRQSQSNHKLRILLVLLATGSATLSPNYTTASPFVVDAYHYGASNKGQSKIKIQGTIVDQNADPIVGATIRVKGTTQATVSKLDGTFTLDNVERTAILTFSYTGFQGQEMAASAIMNVTLQTDNNLDEVVVVG